MTMTNRPVGELLRDWRSRRRISQLELANEAEISARHISFLETGRAKPSRATLLKLADQLAVPLRDRNSLLLAAGFAPLYPERSLDDPELQAARKAIDLVLAGHEPFPALAIDAHWNMVASNRSIALLLEGIDPALLAPPVNVLRLAMHPGGLAPRIMNLPQLRHHLRERLQRQIELTGDPELIALMTELRQYQPGSRHDRQRAASAGDGVSEIVVPLRLATDQGVLTFISATTVFGPPLDITLSELAIESFFPADPATHAVLRAHAAGADREP